VKGKADIQKRIDGDEIFPAESDLDVETVFGKNAEHRVHAGMGSATVQEEGFGFQLPLASLWGQIGHGFPEFPVEIRPDSELKGRPLSRVSSEHVGDGDSRPGLFLPSVQIVRST
jgi:hypothetical protein